MMKKAIALVVVLSFYIGYSQEIEVLYTLDYEAKGITHNNAFHACYGNNETTKDGVFDIYEENGNFVASKDFLKGNYTANPIVYMEKSIVDNPNHSLATGLIDIDNDGYWFALRSYETGANPVAEKILYNSGCKPFLINGVYYGVFYLWDTYDLLDSGYSFPFTGGELEYFIAPLNNDLSIGSWILPITSVFPNVTQIYNIQIMPNGNLMISISGDFWPITSKSITTGNVISTLIEIVDGYGSLDFQRYNYQTEELYAYYSSIWTIESYDSNGSLFILYKLGSISK